MSALRSFRRGTARIWLHKRLILWLYLINLAFAAVLVYPFRTVLGRLGRTDLSDEFVSGFPVDTALEFWAKNAVAFKSLGYSAIALGVAYLIANIFLAGGIVATVSVERRVSLRRFFNDASRYFFRYVRLFVLFAVVVVLAGLCYEEWLSDAVEDLREQAVTGRQSTLIGLGVFAAWLVLLAFTLMVFDYAKIRIVVEKRRSVFLAALLALAFSIRRLPRAVGLFCLNLAVVVLLFAVYLFVENLFSNATTSSIVGLFVVQQLLILGRIWMKVSFYSTQTVYFQSVKGMLPPPRQGEKNSAEQPATPPQVSA